MRNKIDRHATSVIIDAYKVDRSTALDTWMIICRSAKVFLNMYVGKYTQQDVDTVIKSTLLHIATECSTINDASDGNIKIISVQAHIVTIVRYVALRYSRDINE